MKSQTNSDKGKVRTNQSTFWDSNRQRSLEIKRQLLAAEGGYHTSYLAAELLSITESKLTELREQSKIIGLPLAGGQHVYPKWQFDEGEILKGLDVVLSALPDTGPWVQAAFMLDNLISVELVTPLDGLRKRQVDLVVSVARGFGEQGAA